MDENLKNRWHDIRLRATGDASPESITSGRHRTALENLAQRYRRFHRLGLIAALMLSPCVAASHLLPEVWRLPIGIYMTVYFLIASVMDGWLYRGIRSIDCATMTVSEVAGKALFYRKRHLQFMFVLIPMAVIYVGMMAVMTRDPYFIWGVVAGSAVGAIVGVGQFMKFMDDYRALRG